MARIIWDVELKVGGAIKVENAFSMRQAKGFDPDDQFYSDVFIKNGSNGLIASITAYAPNSEIAYKAALYFFGNMVDVLCFKIDIPLYLYYYNAMNTNKVDYTTKRILNREIFEESFRIAREFSMDVTKSTVMRALGWYRKGLVSNDPIDKFLSLWNVIESLAAKFHTDTDRTRNGAINQIYQCFLDYIGREETWGLEGRWINNMHELRSQLAHGGRTIDVDTIGEVSTYNVTLKNQANLLIQKIYDSLLTD
ncbi:MAG: methylamine utilization protein MauJ [Syntrophomonadaceae bacterium]|jgi:hypothetical protein